MKISLFRKIKLFFYYKKALKNIEADLNQFFKIRIDNAYRMYTVLNLSDELIEDENYLLDSKYLESVAQKQLRDYTNKLTAFLNSKGLSELYKFYNITVVDKYSYLLVYGFSLLQTDKIIKKMIYPVAAIIAILLYLLIKTFVH